MPRLKRSKSDEPTPKLPPDRIVRLETGVLLPEQVGQKASSRGALRLMTALLEEATACFQKHVGACEKHDRRRFDEAEEWLMQDDIGATVSFPDVCLVLGLDPDYIRSGLRKWKAEQTRGVPRARNVRGAAPACTTDPHAPAAPGITCDMTSGHHHRKAG